MNWSGQAKTYLELSFLKMTDQSIKAKNGYLHEIQVLEKRLGDLEKELNQPMDFKPLKVEQFEENIVDKQEEEKRNQNQTEQTTLNPKEDEKIEAETEETEIKEEQKQTHTKEEIKNDMCGDISKTYDILFVEDVLNNGDIADRKYLTDEWRGFEKGLVEKDEKYLASLLESGQVVASKKSKIIITFSSATICNKMMMPDNKDIIRNILYNKFNRDIDYMALPTNVFEDITNEFKEAYKKGVEYIKLSQIYCDGLQDVSHIKNTKESQEESKIVSDAKSVFGDLVKVKQ
jgi:hypothetical protein